jgi:oxygen-independent coproporphyrinogen-3 oxidase
MSKTASLAERMAADGYDGYAYSYPHKTAYAPLDPPVSLEQAWRGEDTSKLFLYTHLPFCEMRCGFCNLFTTIRPGQDLVQRTLDAIERQSRVVADCVQPKGVVQAAFGGGTPSYLNERELERLFGILTKHWKVDFSSIPVSFETSPGTVTPEKLALLRQLGVDRLSMGVQSFVAEDLAALKRPQNTEQVLQACQWIKEAGFPIFNIDLIYGNQDQSAASWQLCLERAVAWLPQELYLYPLYVGKLTNLDRLGRRPGQYRRDFFEQARDYLTSVGYRPISMRLFQRVPNSSQASKFSIDIGEPNLAISKGIAGQSSPRTAMSNDSALKFSPKTAMAKGFAGGAQLGNPQDLVSVYGSRGSAPGGGWCCQEDGMVGLGPGARSYTKTLHYSSEYAIGQPGVRAIIQDFGQRTDSQFSLADYGVRLDPSEQKRRYLIKSLLRAEGLNLPDYQQHHPDSPGLLADFPQIQELLQLDLAELNSTTLRLTPQGLSWTDTIGPWLYSEDMTQRMQTYQFT